MKFTPADGRRVRKEIEASSCTSAVRILVQLLDKNHQNARAAGVARVALSDGRYVRARDSTTNMITAQLYVGLPAAPSLTDSFTRLRFRYLIFYCPFVADAPCGSRRLNALALRRATHVRSLALCRWRLETVTVSRQKMEATTLEFY